MMKDRCFGASECLRCPTANLVVVTVDLFFLFEYMLGTVNVDLNDLKALEVFRVGEHLT